jgi:hypothetical protein
MLGTLGFNPGRTDGKTDETTRNATRAFQSSAGLGPDGNAGPATRQALYLRYMDFICRDKNGRPFRLAADQFLGRGADRGGKADFQGCSEFNPVMIFSRADAAAFEKDKARRNDENQVNRRVVVLLFRPGAKVVATRWPCPRVKEPTAGCRSRFFSDAEKRRANRAERREFGTDTETFACRFYDRLINNNSPCERILKLFKIRLFDRQGRVLPGAPFAVSRAGEDTDDDAGSDPETADGNGDITLRDLRVPTTVTVRWSRPQPSAGAPGDVPPKPPNFEFTLDVFVNIPDDAPPGTAPAGVVDPLKALAAQQRLSNLGFAMGETLEQNVSFFQREMEQPETGKLEDIEEELKRRHASPDPPSRYKNRPAQPQTGPDDPQPPIPTPDDV